MEYYTGNWGSLIGREYSLCNFRLEKRPKKQARTGRVGQNLRPRT